MSIIVNELSANNIAMRGKLHVNGDVLITGYLQTHSIINVDGNVICNGPMLNRGNITANTFTSSGIVTVDNLTKANIFNELSVDVGVNIVDSEILFKDSTLKTYYSKFILPNESNILAAGGLDRVYFDTTLSNCSIGQPGYILTGSFNISLFAQNAFSSGTTCSQNIAFGNRSLQNLTTGQKNIAIGTESLSNISTDNNTISIGSLSSTYTDSGGNNVVVGHRSNNQSLAGVNNVVIGNDSSSGDGSTSVIIGHDSGNSSMTSINNVIIGNNTCPNLTSGSYNTVIGANAGAGMISSNYNVVIGEGATANDFSRCVVIGREAAADGDGQIVLGSPIYPINMNPAPGLIVGIGDPLQNPVFFVIERINGVNYKFPRFVTA